MAVGICACRYVRPEEATQPQRSSCPRSSCTHLLQSLKSSVVPSSCHHRTPAKRLAGKNGASNHRQGTGLGASTFLPSLVEALSLSKPEGQQKAGAWPRQQPLLLHCICLTLGDSSGHRGDNAWGSMTELQVQVKQQLSGMQRDVSPQIKDN